MPAARAWVSNAAAGEPPGPSRNVAQDDNIIEGPVANWRNMMDSTAIRIAQPQEKERKP